MLQYVFSAHFSFPHMNDKPFHYVLFWICKTFKLFILIPAVAKGNTPTKLCNRVNMLEMMYSRHSTQTEYKSWFFKHLLQFASTSTLASLQRVCSNSEGRLVTCRLMNVNIEQHCQLHRWPYSLGNRSREEINVLLRLGGASEIFQYFMSYLHRAEDNCIPSRSS